MSIVLPPIRKGKSGFTLIEIMISMTIISLLTLAGTYAYAGYLRSVRDTKRIADIALLDFIVRDMRRNTGKYPDVENFESSIVSLNNGQFISDPLDKKVACLTSASDMTLDYCSYLYNTCDDKDGYTLSAKFETTHHAQKYTKISNETAWYYHVGSCETLDLPEPLTVPDPDLCRTKIDCQIDSVCVGPPPKHCRPKNSQTVGAECDENADCQSNNCNTNAHKCKN